MSALYERALDAGISPESFWEHSPGEVLDMIFSYDRRKKRELKIQISRDFVRASVIRRVLFPGKNEQAPHPWEYYPELFTDEQQTAEVAEEKAQLEEYKANKRAYIEEFNRRLREGGVDRGRR